MRVSLRLPALLILTIATSCVVVTLGVNTEFYIAISNAYLCISDTYTQSLPDVTIKFVCAAKCALNNRCRAFTVANGWCQMFVFDKCSKQLRDCACNRKGQVYVKQQPGLEPGKLCPSGYADDYCGVKYKLYVGSGVWAASRQKCESESGLVIMADVVDANEMSQMEMLFDKYGGKSFWLGGYQRPGSPEPAGGWYWVSCNLTIDSSVWAIGQPSNANGVENAAGRWSGDISKLNDFGETDGDPIGGMCECASPFE